MRPVAFACLAAGAVALAAPAVAQTAADPSNVRAEEVMTSPLADVNLMRKAVPAVLEAALADPYDLTGIESCAGFTTAIMDLDVALGDDIDVAHGKSDEQKMVNSAGVIAKSLIGSFIPFRGVIREVSGANAQRRAWDRAVYAGAVRRAFLKGMGQQRDCEYPARAATPEVLASLAAQRDAERAAKKRKPPAEKTAGAPVQIAFEARPVVQAVPTARR